MEGKSHVISILRFYRPLPCNLVPEHSHILAPKILKNTLHQKCQNSKYLWHFTSKHQKILFK